MSVGETNYEKTRRVSGSPVTGVFWIVSPGGTNYKKNPQGFFECSSGMSWPLGKEMDGAVLPEIFQPEIF